MVCLIPFFFFLNCQGTHFSVYPAFDLQLYCFAFGYLEERRRWEHLYLTCTQPLRSQSQWGCQVKNRKAGCSLDSWDSSCDFGLLLVGFHITVHLGNYFLGSGNSAPLPPCWGFSVWGVQEELHRVCGNSQFRMDKGRNTLGLSGCFSVTFLDWICFFLFNCFSFLVWVLNSILEGEFQLTFGETFAVAVESGLDSGVSSGSFPAPAAPVSWTTWETVPVDTVLKGRLSVPPFSSWDDLTFPVGAREPSVWFCPPFFFPFSL